MELAGSALYYAFGEYNYMGAGKFALLYAADGIATRLFNMRNGAGNLTLFAQFGYFAVLQN